MLQLHDMQFLELKNTIKTRYQNFEKVICPALDLQVSFNAKGFHHITKKSDNDPRPITDQINRLNLIDLTYDLIKHTNTFQEYEKTETTEYWGLIAIYKNKKLKVILRKVGNGNVHFWSVIPGYITSEKRDGKFKMKGNAETD
jgi:hypothetical protein